MTLAAGDKLGPYEILGPIGEGGMGEVWKARDTRLNRFVAIKQLKGEHSARFEQEARAITALNHPHICQIYDVGPDYLVLEYLDGAPLKGPLDAAAARRLALEIACAPEKAFSLAPWYAPVVGLYSGLLIRGGRVDEGEKLVRNLRPGEAYGASAGMALFHTCQGHVDRAADWFEKAIEERNSLVVLVLQSAIGEQLRVSPRWPKLASLMNLPEART